MIGTAFRPGARVSRDDREAMNGHPGCVVYLTGLSASGKSTLAMLVERELHQSGIRTYVIDGDELRAGLCADLGFSDADRVENMRRAAELAWLMADAGLMVITAMISPFRAERNAARARFLPGRFIEVFVDAPLSVCEARDPKGLYRRARRGEIAGLTGIDSPYEPPLQPELRVDSARLSPAQATASVMDTLSAVGVLPRPLRMAAG